MRAERRHRWRRACAGLLALLGLGVLGGSVWLRRSLPALSGSLPAPGLDARVEIVRDRDAIPHVYARSEADAYYGLGLVHAQDRLWQLELMRRAASGRLAELFGPDALGEDRLMRTVGLRRAAERSLPGLDPETRRVLGRYAAGINAGIAAARVLPPELLLLGAQPEPWTELDALVGIKLLAWQLSVQYGRELLRARLLDRLAPEQIASLLGGSVTAIETERSQLGFLETDRSRHAHKETEWSHSDEHLAQIASDPIRGARSGAFAGAFAALERFARGSASGSSSALGSNSWAVSGARSTSGKPLLANDPHLELSMPAVWYLAHLNAPGLNVIGASIPGVPGVIVGRNDDVAWSFTNNRADTQDLYLERVDPSDAGRYLTPSGPAPFERVREVISVRGADPVELWVRSTRHGPVLSDADDSARQLMPDGYVLSLAYAALLPDDQSIRFPLLVAHARRTDDVLRAAETLFSPPQNVVSADRDGAIAFVAAGRVPRRGRDEPGVVPLPGWLPQYDWQGFVPFAELPRSVQPDTGRLVTANQDLTPPGYPHPLGADWAAPQRAQRIAQALDARERHDTRSFETLQHDEYSARAAELVTTWLAAPPIETGLLAAARARLRAWDFVMRQDAPEPLLYAEWLRELTREVFADELGDAYADVTFDNGEQLTSRLLERTSPWCDDVSTPQPESCASVAERAFERAVTALSERLGDDVDDWRWGDAHAVHFSHAPFGGLPLVGSWFDTVLPSGGGNDTVNLAEYLIAAPSEPLTARYGPSYRAICDLADPNASSFIVGVGQSGNPLSPYYRQFAERWARGERVSMTTQRAHIERGALGTLVLEPTH